ncbi:glutathione S-transferase N-terminal domain-containing protein [Roseomonas sp. SSH11]|uniref:Glutathione S-transferase N-terminal domain-containing protein n=1 Tax=Pararoseomonas baculiformis TaxID=2820812 RepID=A0ABS4ABH8_9PROT|nr:glutathione S-transferase N-terminal domain-containing protein [Pararoseomonas baculiformis]MBP0444360.1 glutathione S-transferase N-terminal domain-containing protein [Pararoseomonas baculiformis]
MKLYYAPGACSLGIHIILEEIGKPYELGQVALKEGAQHKPEYVAVNPKSKVPALDLGDGSRALTEFPAIAAYLALSNPEAGLMPKDPLGQARTLEAVDYVTGTIHPHAFTRQFRPNMFSLREEDHPKVVEQARGNAEKFFGVLDRIWAGETWVMPQGYSIADAALFFVQYWQVKRVGQPLPPKVERHYRAMLERPAVQRALEQEGLSA